MITYTTVTMSPDTSAFASGDLIADTQAIPMAFPENSVAGRLESLILIDEDDQGVAVDVYFFDADVTMGTENSAPSISDANARSCLGFVAIATGDYRDLGGVRVAPKTGLNLAVKPPSGSQSIFVAIVNGAGTPTFTAAGIKLRVGIWTPDVKPGENY